MKRLIALFVVAISILVYSGCSSTDAKLSRIEIDDTYGQTEFALYEEFNIDGMIVNAVYSNNTSVEVTENTTIDSTAYNRFVMGTYLINVAYDGKNVYYEVTVGDVNAKTVIRDAMDNTYNKSHNLCFTFYPVDRTLNPYPGSIDYYSFDSNSNKETHYSISYDTYPSDYTERYNLAGQGYQVVYDSLEDPVYSQFTSLTVPFTDRLQSYSQIRNYALGLDLSAITYDTDLQHQTITVMFGVTEEYAGYECEVTITINYITGFVEQTTIGSSEGIMTEEVLVGAEATFTLPNFTNWAE